EDEHDQPPEEDEGAQHGRNRAVITQTFKHSVCARPGDEVSTLSIVDGVPEEGFCLFGRLVVLTGSRISFYVISALEIFLRLRLFNFRLGAFQGTESFKEKRADDDLPVCLRLQVLRDRNSLIQNVSGASV